MTWPGETSYVVAAEVTADSSERRPPLAHRAPRLGADAEPLVDLAHLRLREARVQLDLVDRRRHAGVVDDAGEVLLGEVGDADRAHQPVLLQLDERAPRLDVLALAGVGPVDEVQVDALEPETLQRARAPRRSRRRTRGGGRGSCWRRAPRRAAGPERRSASPTSLSFS